jgi:hypothetical protein
MSISTGYNWKVWCGPDSSYGEMGNQALYVIALALRLASHIHRYTSVFVILGSHYCEV